MRGSSTGGLILKRTRRSCSDRVKTASTSRTANLQERYTPLPSLMLFLMLKIGKYFQYITTNCIVDPQSFFSPISVLNTVYRGEGRGGGTVSQSGGRGGGAS